MQIAYFDDFESLADSENYWNGYVKHLNDYEVIRSTLPWERRKVGVGPPPIKTDLGWLVIYHGVSIERIYRTGAILLDLDNPSKVLARTKEPVLEPEMEFEKYGVVPNVVFPSGAIVEGVDEHGFAKKTSQVNIYYGAADTCVGLAYTTIDELIISAFKM